MRHLGFALVSGSLISICGSAQTVGSFVTSGQGCPGSSLAYEQFAPNTFDLAGVAIEWVPNAREGYVIVPSGTGLLPFGSGTDLQLGDEDNSGAIPLGFTHPYPLGNGSTTQIEVISNGYVYLEPGTIPGLRCCVGDGLIFEQFRNDTPSWALLGMDLDPASGGHVWFDAAPGVAYVTWDRVLETGTASANTFQIQLYPDGRVITAWGAASNTVFPTLVGWSGGGGVEDLGALDLSAALPFDMGGSTGPLTMSAPRGRLPTTGGSFLIDVDNVPPDGSVGVLLLGAFPVGFDLDVLGMPGCDLLTAADIPAVALALAPPAGSVSLAFPTTPGTAGLVVETQSAVISPIANVFGLALSNRGSLTIGDTRAVIVLASGPDCENDDTTTGFWTVINGTQLAVTSLQFSWVGTQNYFDTNQRGMGDFFAAGNSPTPLCDGTYRNGADVTTGLVYASTPSTPCGTGTTGWIGSGLVGPWRYRTVAFTFTSFGPEDAFEVDIDIDSLTGAAPAAGGSMAGMNVTVGLSDGSTRSGALVTLDPLNSRVIL